jgi:hypothetical protein
MHGLPRPAPSNPYSKYLRVHTAKGSKIDAFCVVCHPIKGDAALAGEKPALFSSMDETGNRVLAPKASAPAGDAKTPAAAPAKKTKK